jgi:hypothetical protein
MVGIMFFFRKGNTTGECVENVTEDDGERQ